MSTIISDERAADPIQDAIHNARALEHFEAVVLSQRPPSEPWHPVTDYSREARRMIEGRHPDLIRDVLIQDPRWQLLDAGCGVDAHIVTFLRERGVEASGFDPTIITGQDAHLYRETLDSVGHALRQAGPWHVVMCREVFEHLTVRQIARAVRCLCALTERYVYVTARFAADPHPLALETADTLDPTHISLLSQSFVRALFVLEGFRRRAALETRLDWQQQGRCLVYERAD